MIRESEIVDIVPKMKLVMLKAGPGELFLGESLRYLYFMNDVKWNAFIWNYKKKIMSRNDPNDRYENFEVRIDGSFSYDKYMKVLRSRLKDNEYLAGEEPILF